MAQKRTGTLFDFGLAKVAKQGFKDRSEGDGKSEVDLGFSGMNYLT